MMMKHRIFLLLLVLSLMCGLCACTAAPTDTGASAQTDELSDAQETTASSVSDGTETIIQFTDEAASVSGSGCEADGTALTVSESGVYRLSGSCTDGSVTIKKGTTDVTLILDNLTLTSTDTAPITCGKSSQVTIEAAAGTVNALSDSEQNNGDTYPANENAENAVLKCKDGSQVTLCGTGSLTLTANGKNGIKSGASTDEDGEASLTIRELTLTIHAPVNDAINAGQLLTIESGELTISAADDAIHCDYTLQIGAEGTDGPAISITDCYEGLEAATLNVASGDIRIRASDDCLNAANSDLTGFDFSMNLSGGTINAYTTDGDGFDSNGTMTISGGTICVWTANTADNQPLDADGTITITGGTVLAAGGSAGMGMKLSVSQPYVTFGQSGSMQPRGGGADALISNGSTLAIWDETDTLFSMEAPCSARFVFYSSPELTEDGSYTLLSDGENAGTAEAQTGESQSGFGGMPGGRPGGFDPNGEVPSDIPNSETPPTPPDGGMPPEKPDGTSMPEPPDGSTPPEKPDGAPEPPDSGSV